MESGGGGEQNYWPGFVDALSNVVLTLIFVLVIFVFALVMASNKVEKKRQELVEAGKINSQTSPQASQQQIQVLQQQLAQAQKALSDMKAQQGTLNPTEKNESGASDQNAVTAANKDAQIQIENKEQSKAQNQGPVDIRARKDQITLAFPLSVSDMDEKSSTELGHVLEAVVKPGQKKRIILKSIMGRESYSAAQRLAYYRALGVRNFLITKRSVDPALITSTIVKPDSAAEGRVEIVFENQ